MAKQGNVQSVIINIDLLETMKAELEKVDLTGEIREPCTIYRMLPSARSKHSEEYEPQIISIGPLHVKKTTLEPMKSVKWRYLRDLLHRRPDVQDMLERYIKKVKELEERARKKYAEVIDLDSDAFVQIMVVDACFIIELLIKWHYEDIADLAAENWRLPLLMNDLLLLENQIPFFIVQSLFELSNIPGLLDLEKLAISYVTEGKSDSVPATTLRPKDVHHLLHLYHLFFLPTSTQMNAPSCGHRVMNTIKKIGSVASRSLFWLIISFIYCRLPLKCHQQNTDEEGLEAPKMIPSATELEESGVEFKRNKAPKMIPSATELEESGVEFKRKKAPKMIPSATEHEESGVEFKRTLTARKMIPSATELEDKRKEAMSLLDVTFRDGVMEIPFLSVDDNTALQFRNLIAFEQCCPTSGDHFTSYAAFIDNLINTPKDVAILKKCGIIESMLGRDEEVADLFNSLCKGAYLDVERHYLAHLFKDVKQYSEVSRHKWRARLMRDYFVTPWSTISVIAAIILLILTVVQAIYAILAYHKPPK